MTGSKKGGKKIGKSGRKVEWKKKQAELPDPEEIQIPAPRPNRQRDRSLDALTRVPNPAPQPFNRVRSEGSFHPRNREVSATQLDARARRLARNETLAAQGEDFTPWPDQTFSVQSNAPYRHEEPESEWMNRRPELYGPWSREPSKEMIYKAVPKHGIPGGPTIDMPMAGGRRIPRPAAEYQYRQPAGPPTPARTSRTSSVTPQYDRPYNSLPAARSNSDVSEEAEPLEELFHESWSPGHTPPTEVVKPRTATGSSYPPDDYVPIQLGSFRYERYHTPPDKTLPTESMNAAPLPLWNRPPPQQVQTSSSSDGGIQFTAGGGGSSSGGSDWGGLASRAAAAARERTPSSVSSAPELSRPQGRGRSQSDRRTEDNPTQRDWDPIFNDPPDTPPPNRRGSY